MSPDVHFHLDCKSFEECITLLSNARMEFVESRREHFDPCPIPVHGLTGECDRIIGTLRSSRGTHKCYLQSRARRFSFVVTLEFRLAIQEDLKRAFAGHLRDYRKRAKP